MLMRNTAVRNAPSSLLQIALLIFMLCMSSNSYALSSQLIERVSVYLADTYDNQIGKQAALAFTSCDIKLLREKSRSEFYLVRWAAAENKCSDTDIRSRLAKDESEDVRQGVINFREAIYAPVETLQRLSDSKLSSLRMLVAHALNTPAELVTKMLNDSNSSVVAIAKRR